MRVIITGGAGFIGSHVVDAMLVAGHEPHVLDNLSSGNRLNLPADVEVTELDIRDADAVSRAFERIRPDAVSHHAAQVSVSRSVRDPGLDADINLVGLVNVLAAAHQSGSPRFVFASSGGALYGETPKAADEQTEATPISPYGIGKWAGEQYLGWAASELGLASVSLRYSNVYGPRQSVEGEAGVVAAFCRDLEEGRRLTIHGDGCQTRDFVYVEDVARANVAALERAIPGSHLVVNVSAGEAIDINRLADRLQEEVARTLERERVESPEHTPPREGDIRHSLLDPSAAAELLGWHPSVALEDGLARTVRWMVAASSDGD